MKVQDLARSLSISPRELLKFIHEINVKAKSGSTKLAPETVTHVKSQYERRMRPQQDKEDESEPKITTVSLKEKNIKMGDLVILFGLSVPEVMTVVLKKGLLLSINSEVDQETAIEIGKGLNINVEIEDTTVEEEIGLKTKVMEIEEQSAEEKNSNIKPRPPVITIMGHVDHGKTQLLDTIRKSNVVSKESGGITQHIGAYQVTTEKRQVLTFLDTPGHEAFTSLRARGAQVTDIAILVVAADEGVKPQTVEAIHHAQAADVPIIVAINKVDKPEADTEKVKQGLSQYNLLSEDWGGDTVMVPVSAKTGKGIDSLLEMISLVSEMLELKANYNGYARAVVIESHLSKQRGPIASVLVKTGTLSIGNCFVIDSVNGKVRAMVNDLGKPVKAAFPGDPVEILGMQSVPQPGEILEVVKSDKQARAIAEERALSAKADRLQNQSVSLESLSSQAEDGKLRNLNLVIKSDVHGSLEAIKTSIDKIESKDVPIRILHAATGAINENDVMLAKASSALILGFGVSVSSESQLLAEKSDINIKLYDIIYELLDDVENVIKGLYRIEFEEVEIGQVEVRQLFKFSRVGAIAGSYVTDGKIHRDAQVKVYRDNKEITRSPIQSLKRFKEDVKEVASGFECGIVLENYNQLEEGDKLVVYEVKEKKLV